MLRPIDKSPHQTKASCRAAKALRPVMIATSWRVSAGAIAAFLLVSSASADDVNIPAWSWKFQKHPMASPLEYCSKNAPTEPGKADRPWRKVLETIQAAADKWKYSRKDPNKDPGKDPTIFQFRFVGGDCPRCPGLNYIEFGVLKDDKDTPTDKGVFTDKGAPTADGAPTLAKTFATPVPGTDHMRRCAIRFNSDVSWYVGDDNPAGEQYDLFSVALYEFGHCVGLANVTSGTLTKQRSRELQQADNDNRNKIYGDP